MPEPAPVVTTTSPVPLPAGVTAKTCVASTTAYLVALSPSKVTAVAPVKSVPIISTAVPPALGPELGEQELMVGAAILIYLHLDSFMQSGF